MAIGGLMFQRKQPVTEECSGVLDDGDEAASAREMDIMQYIC